MALATVRLPSDWTPAADSLAGRVILVTGAYGGLGGAVARASVRAGATVILAGRKVRMLEKLYDELLTEGGEQPVIHPLDMESATPADYLALAEGLEAEFGRLDGLVHAAAHFVGLTPMAMHKPDDWLRTMQVNLSGPFALTQACLPLLKAAADSAVVFVLDDPERLGRAHWGGYGVAKAGLERMVSILHEENDDASVRVHALLPAPMRTAVRRMAYFGEDTLQQPLPDVAAAAVTYLLSPAGTPARGAILDLRSD
jgi:NAD(P)-dependent dehydrogenase (short-subunit alcohol dehydrogenase family)